MGDTRVTVIAQHGLKHDRSASLCLAYGLRSVGAGSSAIFHADGMFSYHAVTAVLKRLLTKETGEDTTRDRLITV